MRAFLRQAWDARKAGQRDIILLLTLLLGAAAYLLLVQAGYAAHQRLQSGVASLRSQAAGVVQQAAELDRLRATPAAPASATDLRTLVEAHAGAAGLAHALLRVEARDAHRVVVVFGAIGFADWLQWVDGLGAQRVLVETCQIDALSAPGSVSVTATLLRAAGP